ncbi:MAG: hypothetical protein QOI90_2418, partial [Mycobacterium sp.]|nr:hypothetical protein [Mycobacterium sp.]
MRTRDSVSQIVAAAPHRADRAAKYAARVTTPGTFTPPPEMFDKLYRGEPTFEGAPPPTAIPWDIAQAQPRLMELEALGAITGDVL